MFPETGRQCHFKESIYPIKPWAHNCVVYQAKDICNTYEISTDGNYIKSCDIALKKGVCIPRNNKQNECLEFKHSNLAYVDLAKKKMGANHNMVVSSVVMISALMAFSF